jgi:hypothetical protein
MSLDRKTLIAFQSIPGEVARFGEGSHFVGRRRKLASPGAESSVKKLGE